MSLTRGGRVLDRQSESLDRFCDTATLDGNRADTLHTVSKF